VIGQTISHYRIVERLGEGGMGVVYKAEDTKLRRTVALKFLLPHLVSDDAVKERFLREAQAAAALDHGNICTVYEIDEQDGQMLIGMAFIDGQSVASKIQERPLPLQQALDLAIQTAQGLQEAHGKGIIHRDIKSSNVLLTSRGEVKITDFGLAQLAERSRLTKSGSTLGTPACMSPEQAQNQLIDHRTDIWSLGVMLYEMLTGRLPFDGDYEQAVIYAIVNEEPEPVTALRAGIPIEVEWIVAKALAKHADERYQHADELIVDLKAQSRKLASGQSPVPVHQPAAAPDPTPAHDLLAAQGTRTARVSPAPATPQTDSAAPAPAMLVPAWKLRLYQALFGAAVLFALGVSYLFFIPQPVEQPLRRFAVTPPVPLGFGVAISPNGKHIAFTGRGTEGMLWIHDLDQQEPRAIEGTEGAGQAASAPSWSPASDFVAFATARELKKVSLQGGPAIGLCELPPGRMLGACWSRDGSTIVFGHSAPFALYQVPASGGSPKPLITAEDPSTGAAWGVIVRPHFLPLQAGKRVLVFSFGSPRSNQMMLQDLDTGRRKVLGPGNFPYYSPSGHLLYQPAFETHEVWALPFSLKTLDATGEAFPVAGNDRIPTVDDDQTLVYVDSAAAAQNQLVWLDRTGRRIGVIGQAPSANQPALSPDGQLIALTAIQNSNLDVWIWNIAQGVKARLTTTTLDDGLPVWSPTGDELAFSSNQAGNYDIFMRRADGVGEEKALAATASNEYVTDWSRDGKHILYDRTAPETGIDLWRLELKEDGRWEPHPFLQTRSSETMARVSPDGQYVAYESDETGQNEIYVQPFPHGGRKWPVSANGGTQPRWSRNGKELFYVEGTTLVVVSVSTTPSFAVGLPAKLFPFADPGAQLRQSGYDVSPDGQRFVFSERVGEAPQPAIRVVQNWFEEFRDRQQN
jgi:Tol biopolymer transport system component